MTITRNAIILVLTVAVVTLGYYYYVGRQNVIEIKLPNISIEKQ
jgi:hypothetical protein